MSGHCHLLALLILRTAVYVLKLLLSTHVFVSSVGPLGDTRGGDGRGQAVLQARVDFGKKMRS